MSLSDLPLPARRELIASALDDAQLAHTWLPGAQPVASLAVQLPHRPRLELTARHTGSVLQLIAHSILPGPREPQRIADVDMLNQEWGIGRVYFVEATGAWDASIGLLARARLPAGMIQAALATLADAPALYAAGHAPQVLTEPQPAIADIMPRVRAALAAAGLHPADEHGGDVVSVVLQLDKLRAKVSWFLAGAVLVARAQPIGARRVDPTPDALVALDKLNGRLDIGGVGLWYEHAIAYGWIGHLAAWLDITPDHVRWTSERAASWAEAAQLG